MKKIIMMLLLFAAVHQLNAQFKSASLQASGLTCSMCSKAVKSALEKVPFVNSVKVNIKTQEYMLAFKDSAELNFDDLKQAVEDAGFSVAALKLTIAFDSLRIEKNKHIQIGDKNFHFLNGTNQLLNGERTISIVDKNFVPDKEFNKYTASKMKCIETGKAGECCEKSNIPADARVYHVII